MEGVALASFQGLELAACVGVRIDWGFRFGSSRLSVSET